MSSELVERIRTALPGYEIGAEIARGGFGVVLFGTHLRLQRKVAIKVLPDEVAHEEDVRHRFAAEARIMAEIDHQHVVRIHDYIEDENLCLFVMEYLPGGTVLSRFNSESFDATAAIAVALACASALEAAHAVGIQHRDVKPANLLFAENGTVKLADFGIAKIVGGDGSKTRAGEIVGTAWYIAPEQVLGTKITPATDIYALCTVLYQLLTGMLPFPPNDEAHSIFLMHAFGKPIPLRSVASKIPPPIADVVMRGLATDPKNRWHSAEQFGVALATATTQCWGPNWLSQSGIPVLGNESIKAAIAGISSPPAMSAGPWSPAPPAPRPQRAGGALVDGEVASPRMPWIVAGVLAVAAIVLALVGLGSPARGGDLKPGTVTIAGVDPVTAGDVEIDMTKPIPVTVKGISGDETALTQHVLGIPVSTNDAPLAAEGPGLTAELNPPNPYLLAGQMSGELRITKGDNTTASLRFGMRSTQSAATTAFAAGVVFLALFAVAYIESYTRTLRRGLNQMSARVGLPIASAVLAVAMVGAVWILVGREPTVATLIVCAVIGAAAGVSATLAVMRHGEVNRNRRMQRTPRPAKVSGRTPRPTKMTGGTPRPARVSGGTPRPTKAIEPTPPPTDVINRSTPPPMNAKRKSPPGVKVKGDTTGGKPGDREQPNNDA